MALTRTQHDSRTWVQEVTRFCLLFGITDPSGQGSSDVDTPAAVDRDETEVNTGVGEAEVLPTIRERSYALPSEVEEAILSQQGPIASRHSISSNPGIPSPTASLGLSPIMAGRGHRAFPSQVHSTLSIGQISIPATAKSFFPSQDDDLSDIQGSVFLTQGIKQERAVSITSEWNKAWERMRPTVFGEDGREEDEQVGWEVAFSDLKQTVESITGSVNSMLDAIPSSFYQVHQEVESKFLSFGADIGSIDKQFKDLLGKVLGKTIAEMQSNKIILREHGSITGALASLFESLSDLDQVRAYSEEKLEEKWKSVDEDFDGLTREIREVAQRAADSLLLALQRAQDVESDVDARLRSLEEGVTAATKSVSSGVSSAAQSAFQVFDDMFTPRARGSGPGQIIQQAPSSDGDKILDYVNGQAVSAATLMESLARVSEDLKAAKKELEV